MKLNLLAFAVPLFIGLMSLEYFIIKKRKLGYASLHTSIANISIGIAERLTDVLVTGVFYFIYDSIQKKYGIFHIKANALLWILLLLATDFVWYWYHRLAHEINILWAAHVVHHQSEEFNYTVSARITVLQAFIRTGFWAVLPLLGFPATMITSMLLIHGLYPFFIHTRLVRKLGVLEYIFVTPSHHRVHHASDEKYLDKNYGDVLIIWDKLFGTFQTEEEEPAYGLTHSLNSYSFLWQHFHYFIEIALAVKKQKGFYKKLQILFSKPSAMNDNIRTEAEKIFRIQHNKETIRKPLNQYVVWQVIVLLVTLFVFILFEHQLSFLFIFSFTAFTILTLINCGAIMEQKRWVFDVEFLRIFALALVPMHYAGYTTILSIALLLSTLVLIYYSWLKESYLSLVYNGRFINE